MMRLFAAFACFALLPVAAWAEPGRAGEVYSPRVSQGESELELLGGAFDGGARSNDWQVKAEFSYGFTEWWRPGLVAKWESASGDFTAFAIENVFDFTATREWPVHVGAYGEVQFADPGADEIELKLLLERERGQLDLRLNLIAERHFGAGASDGWEYGYAGQAGYAFNDDFALGVQGFGDAGAGALDAHAHYWGPFGQFELAHVGTGEVELQLGYLFGSGEASADGQLRLKLEYEFGEPH